MNACRVVAVQEHVLTGIEIALGEYAELVTSDIDNATRRVASLLRADEDSAKLQGSNYRIINLARVRKLVNSYFDAELVASVGSED